MKFAVGILLVAVCVLAWWFSIVPYSDVAPVGPSQGMARDEGRGQAGVEAPHSDDGLIRDIADGGVERTLLSWRGRVLDAGNRHPIEGGYLESARGGITELSEGQYVIVGQPGIVRLAAVGYQSAEVVLGLGAEGFGEVLLRRESSLPSVRIATVLESGEPVVGATIVRHDQVEGFSPVGVSGEDGIWEGVFCSPGELSAYRGRTLVSNVVGVGGDALEHTVTLRRAAFVEFVCGERSVDIDGATLIYPSMSVPLGRGAIRPGRYQMALSTTCGWQFAPDGDALPVTSLISDVDLVAGVNRIQVVAVDCCWLDVFLMDSGESVDRADISVLRQSQHGEALVLVLDDAERAANGFPLLDDVALSDASCEYYAHVSVVGCEVRRVGPLTSGVYRVGVSRRSVSQRELAIVGDYPLSDLRVEGDHGACLYRGSGVVLPLKFEPKSSVRRVRCNLGWLPWGGQGVLDLRSVCGRVLVRSSEARGADLVLRSVGRDEISPFRCGDSLVFPYVAPGDYELIPSFVPPTHEGAELARITVDAGSMQEVDLRSLSPVSEVLFGVDAIGVQLDRLAVAPVWGRDCSRVVTEFLAICYSPGRFHVPTLPMRPSAFAVYLKEGAVWSWRPLAMVSAESREVHVRCASVRVNVGSLSVGFPVELVCRPGFLPKRTRMGAASVRVDGVGEVSLEYVSEACEFLEVWQGGRLLVSRRIAIVPGGCVDVDLVL